MLFFFPVCVWESSKEYVKPGGGRRTGGIHDEGIDEDPDPHQCRKRKQRRRILVEREDIGEMASWGKKNIRSSSPNLEMSNAMGSQGGQTGIL